MEFNIIVGVDEDNGISKNGLIPWHHTHHCVDDLKLFRHLTLNSIIIMGRKTWESIANKPLKDRINIVLTRDSNYKIGNPEVHVVNKFDIALKMCIGQNKKVWVIGGAEIYDLALNHPLLQHVYVNKIPTRYDCDKFFKLRSGLNLININHYFKIDEKLVTPQLKVYEYKNVEELVYLELCEKLLTAPIRNNRTGTPTHSLFSQSLRFKLYDEHRGNIIPLLTTKKVPYKLILTELLWFLSGKCTNISYLKLHKNNIWDGNTSRQFLDSRGMTVDKGYEPGDTGKIYGFQWRNWNGSIDKNDGIDQLSKIIETLKRDPFDRRMIVSVWNPEQFQDMALPPCHWSFQFYVDNDDLGSLRLNCQVNMRSGDMALGVPFNIASYAILTHIIAKIVNMKSGELVLVITDCHLYTNHVNGINIQIKRRPYQFPTFEIDPTLSNNLDEIANSDLSMFKLKDYHSYPSIKYDMAI